MVLSDKAASAQHSISTDCLCRKTFSSDIWADRRQLVFIDSSILYSTGDVVTDDI